MAPSLMKETKQTTCLSFNIVKNIQRGDPSVNFKIRGPFSDLARNFVSLIACNSNNRFLWELILINTARKSSNFLPGTHFFSFWKP